MKKYRVISTQKQTALVLNTQNNLIDACFFARKEKPICGDYVEIQKNTNENVIAQIYERSNCFSRANHKGQKQSIAANVDIQIIVVAVHPEPNRDLINRYLIAAHNCNMQVIIVFNKNDIDTKYFDKTIQLYDSLGYKTLSTSTKNNTNIKQLEQLIREKTSIFVGMSGVGKSSLSELLLNTKIKTGDVSKKTGKGSHVTSVTQLYPLSDDDHTSKKSCEHNPGNIHQKGYLIDSPGVWEYGLWKMSIDEIAYGFPEIYLNSHQCKFNNCTHTHEPKCSVKIAMDAKQITTQRYQSYLRIIDSMKYWD